MTTARERDQPASKTACSPGARAEKLVEMRLDRTGTRRHFLKLAAGAGAAAAASASGCGEGMTAERFFQQHYQRLSAADKRRIFERLEETVRRRTGVEVRIGDPPPIEGVEFAFALNLSKCNGNRRCVEACVRENNLSRDPAMAYIRVL